MNAFQLLPVQGKLAYTFDFSDVIPSTSPLTTVSSITVTADSAVTVGTQTDVLASYKTTVIFSGLSHAGQYLAQAIAVLSNGEEIPKDLTLIGFNGA